MAKAPLRLRPAARSAARRPARPPVMTPRPFPPY